MKTFVEKSHPLFLIRNLFIKAFINMPDIYIAITFIHWRRVSSHSLCVYRCTIYIGLLASNLTFMSDMYSFFVALE